MPLGMIFFDIDGTLVAGTSSGSFIAERLGSLGQMSAAERAYEEGRITNDEVCAIDAEAWAGHTRREVEGWLAEVPLIAGIQETVDACRALGFKPYIASLAWTVVGEYLCRRFDFVGCCGPQLEERGGIFTGRVARGFDEHGKPAFARLLCVEQGIAPACCIAVGDSRSDVPLFETVGLAIAINASEGARKAAQVQVDTSSMTDIIPAVRDYASVLQ